MRRFPKVFFILAAIGLLSLSRVMSRPGFEVIQAVDVVLLIGTGMCFGAAIMALGLFLRGRTPQS